MRCGAVRHAWNSSRRDHERSTHRDRVLAHTHTLRRRTAPAMWCLSRFTGSKKSLGQKRAGGPVRGRENRQEGCSTAIETRTGRAMDPSISLDQDPNVSAIGAPPLDLCVAALPTEIAVEAGDTRRRLVAPAVILEPLRGKIERPSPICDALAVRFHDDRHRPMCRSE